MIAKGHKCSPLSAILHSVWRFFRAYVLRRGFLDGFAGWYLASVAAFVTFIKYAKLCEHQVITKEPGQHER
jgi:hypothetical protein